MPHFLTQAAYTEQAWQSLVSNPQNRLDAIRPVIEKLGGRVVNAYFAFGDYDGVARQRQCRSTRYRGLRRRRLQVRQDNSADGSCRRPGSPSKGGYLRVSRSNGRKNRYGVTWPNSRPTPPT